MGRTTDGRTFRPSDWGEWLGAILSVIGADRKMEFSPYVRPGCTLTGATCMMVDGQFHEIEPLAYSFLVCFARDDDLEVDYEA